MKGAFTRSRDSAVVGLRRDINDAFILAGKVTTGGVPEQRGGRAVQFGGNKDRNSSRARLLNLCPVFD